MVNFFSVGMTKSEVMSKLGSTQSTEKTKQFIQNFWNTDIDGKVTNEIELAMLESWASGSKKVKMPTKGSKLISEGPHTDNGLVISDYQSHSGTKDVFEIVKQMTRGITMMVTATWNGNGQTDTLFDLDGDGYADVRDFKTDEWNVNPSHTDKNMDGNLIDKESSNKIQKTNLDNPISFDKKI